MKTKNPHVYFLDTVRFVDEKKLETTVRRSVMASKIDAAKTSFVEGDNSSPELILAKIDSAVFSPTCIECGAKHKDEVLFYRPPDEQDTKLGAEGVIHSYSVCDSIHCRHRIRQRVKREANGRRLQFKLLHRRKCDKCGKFGEGVRVCSGCQMKRYCGSECQKADWKSHKPDCKACKV